MTKSFQERLYELLGWDPQVHEERRFEPGPVTFARTKLLPFVREHPMTAGALGAVSMPLLPVLAGTAGFWAWQDSPRIVLGEYHRAKGEEALAYLPLDPFQDPLGRLETRVNPETGQREVKVPGWFKHPWPLTEPVRGLTFREVMASGPIGAAGLVARELRDPEDDENWITEEEYHRRFREFISAATSARNVTGQIQYRRPDGSVDVLRQSALEVMYDFTIYFGAGLGVVAKGFGLGARGLSIAGRNVSRPALARSALQAARALRRVERAVLVAQFGWESFERLQALPIIFVLSRGWRVLRRIPPFRWLSTLSQAGQIAKELQELEQALEDLFDSGYDLGQVTMARSTRGEAWRFDVPMFRRDPQGGNVPLTPQDQANIERRFITPLVQRGWLMSHRWEPGVDDTTLVLEVPEAYADHVRDALHRSLFGPPPSPSTGTQAPQSPGPSGPGPAAPGPQPQPASPAVPQPVPQGVSGVVSAPGVTTQLGSNQLRSVVVGSGNYVLISADKPGLSPEQLSRRRERLFQDLVQLGYTQIIPARVVEGGEEKGAFLVPGMTEEHAVKLGRRFRQQSVLLGDRGLLFLSGKNQGKVAPRVDTQVLGDQEVETVPSYIEIETGEVPFRFSVVLGKADAAERTPAGAAGRAPEVVEQVVETERVPEVPEQAVEVVSEPPAQTEEDVLQEHILTELRFLGEQPRYWVKLFYQDVYPSALRKIPSYYWVGRFESPVRVMDPTGQGTYMAFAPVFVTTDVPEAEIRRSAEALLKKLRYSGRQIMLNAKEVVDLWKDIRAWAVKLANAIDQRLLESGVYEHISPPSWVSYLPEVPTPMAFRQLYKTSSEVPLELWQVAYRPEVVGPEVREYNYLVHIFPWKLRRGYVPVVLVRQVDQTGTPTVFLPGTARPNQERFYYHRLAFNSPEDAVRAASRDFLEELQEHNLASWVLINEHLDDIQAETVRRTGKTPAQLGTSELYPIVNAVVRLRRELGDALEKVGPVISPEQYREWARVRSVLQAPPETLPEPVREVVQRYLADPRQFEMGYAASPMYLNHLILAARSGRRIQDWEGLVPFLTPSAPASLRFPGKSAKALMGVLRAVAMRSGDQQALERYLERVQSRVEAERGMRMQMLPDAAENLKVYLNQRWDKAKLSRPGAPTIRELVDRLMRAVYDLFSQDPVRVREGEDQVRRMLQQVGYRVRDLGHFQPGVSVQIGNMVHRISPGLLSRPDLDIDQLVQLLIRTENLDEAQLHELQTAKLRWIRKQYVRFRAREPLPPELTSPSSLLERELIHTEAGNFSARVASVVAYLLGRGDRMPAGEAARLIQQVVDSKVSKIKVTPGEEASAVISQLGPEAESWMRRLAKSPVLRPQGVPAIVISENPKGTFTVHLQRWDEEWLINFLFILRRAGVSASRGGEVKIAGKGQRFQALRSLLEYADLLGLRELRERVARHFRLRVVRHEGPLTYREAEEQAARQAENLEGFEEEFDPEETPFFGARRGELTPVVPGEGLRVERVLEDPREMERGALSPVDLASGPLQRFLRTRDEASLLRSLENFQRSFQFSTGVDLVEVLERTALGEVGPLIDAVLRAGGTVRMSREGLFLERQGKRLLLSRFGVGPDAPETALGLLGPELDPEEVAFILEQVSQRLRQRLGVGTKLEEWEEISLGLISPDEEVQKAALRKLDTLTAVFKTSESRVLQATGAPLPQHHPLPPLVEARIRHRLAEALESLQRGEPSSQPDLFELAAALRLARMGDLGPLLQVLGRFLPGDMIDPGRGVLIPRMLSGDLLLLYSKIRRARRTGRSLIRLTEQLVEPETVRVMLDATKEYLGRSEGIFGEEAERTAEVLVGTYLEQFLGRLHAARPTLERVAREFSELTKIYMARTEEISKDLSEAALRRDRFLDGLDPKIRGFLQRIQAGENLIGRWLSLKASFPDFWSEADEVILNKVMEADREYRRLQARVDRIKERLDNLGRELAPWLYDPDLQRQLKLDENADFLLRLTALRDLVEEMMAEIISMLDKPMGLTVARQFLEEIKVLTRPILPEAAFSDLERAIQGEVEPDLAIPLDEEGLLRYLFGADLDEIPLMQELLRVEPRRLVRLTPPAERMAEVPEWAREQVWTRFADLSWDGVVRGPLLSRSRFEGIPPLMLRLRDVLETKLRIVRELMGRSRQELAELGPGADERARGTAVSLVQLGTSVETLLDRWWRLAEVFIQRDVEGETYRYGVSLGEAVGRYLRGDPSAMVEFLTSRILIDPSLIQVGEDKTITVLAGNGALITLPRRAPLRETVGLIEILAASYGHLVEVGDLRRVHRGALWHAGVLQPKRFLREIVEEVKPERKPVVDRRDPYWNRKEDQLEVESRFGVPAEGNEQARFYLPDGTLFAEGYVRIVYGDHGPYYEFRPDQVKVPLVDKFKRQPPPNAYYRWKYPQDHPGVKVYEQLRDVKKLPNAPARDDGKPSRFNRPEGYADYRPGMLYVPVWEGKEHRPVLRYEGPKVTPEARVPQEGPSQVLHVTGAEPEIWGQVERADLFDLSDRRGLIPVVTTNTKVISDQRGTRLVMGAGLARAAYQRDPSLGRIGALLTEAGHHRIDNSGSHPVYLAPGTNTFPDGLTVELDPKKWPRGLVLFPTKVNPSDASRLSDVETGMERLIETHRREGLQYGFALPLPGGGLGRLDAGQVYAVLDRTIGRTDIPWVVSELDGGKFRRAHSAYQARVYRERARIAVPEDDHDLSLHPERVGVGERFKVLVTGDRNWDDRDLIRQALSRFPKDTIVIHGAARGADSIAGEVAQELGLEVRAYPAQWERYGKAAGFIRNRQMLDEESPDLVLAFHHDLSQSRGTRDMVQAAHEAGYPVLWIRNNDEDLLDLDRLLDTGSFPERAVRRVAAVGLGIGEGVERYLRQAAGYLWLQDLVSLIRDALTPIGMLDERTIKALGLDVADPMLAAYFRPPQVGQGQGVFTHPLFGVGQLEHLLVEMTSPSGGYRFEAELPPGSLVLLEDLGKMVEVTTESGRRYRIPENLGKVRFILSEDRELRKATEALIERVKDWYLEELERLSGPLLDRLADLPPEFRKVASQRVQARVRALLEDVCSAGT